MWIPEWLGIPYCILYAKYKRREFTFEGARTELDISESNLLKVLSELGKRGFLISKIQDKQRKYMLSDFDSIALGIMAAKNFGGIELTEKLKKAYKEYKRKYLIVGDSAAFIYHVYQFPVKYEVEVFPEDYGFWSKLIPDAIIIPKLDGKKLRGKKIVEGLFIASPERVIVEGLKEGGISSALDSVSIIISGKLNWKKLRRYALQYDVVGELGAILEVLDGELKKEYGKSPLPKKIFNELFTHIEKKGRMKEYPKTVIEKERTYFKIGEKWRLKLYLPSYVIRKPVEDLGAI